VIQRRPHGPKIPACGEKWDLNASPQSAGI
jgi:hypothetical protein